MTKKPTVEDPSIDLGQLDENTAELVEVEVPVKVKPAAKPGDPDYDWADHYGVPAEKLYLHTYPGGQVVALRRFKDIYSKQWLRSIKELQTEFDIESEAVDRATTETARKIIDSQPAPLDGPDHFADLWAAWSSADTELSAGE